MKGKLKAVGEVVVKNFWYARVDMNTGFQLLPVLFTSEHLSMASSVVVFKMASGVELIRALIVCTGG